MYLLPPGLFSVSIRDLYSKVYCINEWSAQSEHLSFFLTEYLFARINLLYLERVTF